MAPTISSETASSLRTYIDTHTTGDKPLLPGAIVHFVNANNETLFSHASSTTSATPASATTLFKVHSLTKIIGAIAFFQLVDRGLVSLDDADTIEKLLPELASKKVLTGYTETENGEKNFHFEDRTAQITPRMLMNHTYGGGHTYFNPLLNTYLASFPDKSWEERNEGSDFYQTLLDSPLLWQPGTKTNYAQGFDWLAVFMERLLKKSLADILRESIFEPLGLTETGYEGQYGSTLASSGTKFWPRSLKTENGFTPIDPLVQEPVEREDAYPKGTHHNYPLGTGLVSTAKDLSRILALLLPQNAGVDPLSGTRILTAPSVAEITSPQLPSALRNDSRIVPTAIPFLIIPGDLQAAHVDPEGSFGLGCAVQGEQRVLSDGKVGRSKGSVYWYGAANTEFWVDGEKGIVGVVEGNFFPWNEGGWLEFVAGVEGRVYEGLGGV
jgi:methyl acetate hydrolase